MTLLIKTISTVLSAACIALISTSSVAEKRNHRQPPPEAFEACEDKSEGDVVSVTTPHGDTLDATCQLMKDQLVAIPERGPASRFENRD